ncbi:hypothetical protein WH47_02529 [Habropoda laboriosa]|uniref:Uncharacterized protein n=1 Tax=Habropoda laboriosa TaxID=597456 RepID=A0A0L7QW71_9HYME|nr:PREDICTED: uncharacterized protein LOC108574540 [Habropoda laboriosa]KOC62826.1 hypothetical protein WH47_02529 [Habropoda laboriosa]
MTEDVSVMFQKGLSEWWNEETEYIFQRIERWAAYARGYNRLRSQRLSRGRMTMQGGQEPRWNICSNKLIVDDSSWNPSFHTLKKSQRKPQQEEMKINCCGTFNYQSNSNLDSTCLETYRYDHSIYFKTIGDIKNGKKEAADARNEQDDRISVSSEEVMEWDVSMSVNSMSDFITNQLMEDRFVSDNVKNVFDCTENPAQNMNSVTWFNVDLYKLDLNEDATVADSDEQNNENNLTITEIVEEKNNNYIENKESVMDTNLKNQTQVNHMVEGQNSTGETQPERGIERFFNIRKTRRTTKTVKQSPITGDNDVTWPSVLLNYSNNKNINPFNSPHHYVGNELK